jgi:calmodulin
MSDEELRDLMNEVDTNKNGQIDFGLCSFCNVFLFSSAVRLEEFCQLMARNWSGSLDSEEDILEAFRAFDTDGSGSISVDEFRLFFSKLSWNLTTEEVFI